MKILASLLLFVSFSTEASTVARVLEVKGKAFAFNGKSNPSTLKYGDKIEDLSDVMIEDGSHLSLVNTEGHVYHITGGSLVKLYKRNLELKNGQVWTVAKESRYKATVMTTNGVVEYTLGQFVTSFDNISGKTQVLVITGDVKLANIIETNLYTSVTAGNFSIIDPDYENNLPRTPTKVGASSFSKLRSEFAHFETLDNPQLEKMLPVDGVVPKKKGRTIASVIGGYTGKKTEKKGRIIKIYSGANRKPASAMGYYMKLKKSPRANRQASKGPTAKVRYFGWKPKQTIKTNIVQGKIEKKVTPQSINQDRVPASIPKVELKREPSSIIKELKGSKFDKSYKKESGNIKRHSDELNYLIDNLKSYRKDYQKDY